MDDPAQVVQYAAAGREAAVMKPTHLLHATRASRIISDGDRVLDLGCGPGTLLAEMASLTPGAAFVGCDLSKPMLACASDYVRQRRLTNVEFETADMTRLDYPDAAFDAVTCSMTLHHLPSTEDLRRCLGEVARVIKPGGGVYLGDFVRPPRAWFARWLSHRREDRQPPFFTRDFENSLRAAFTLRELEAAGADAGLPLTWRQTRPLAFMAVGSTPPRRLSTLDLDHHARKTRAEFEPWLLGDDRTLRLAFRLGGLRAA